MTDRTTPQATAHASTFRSFAELLQACRELFASRLGAALANTAAEVDATFQQRRKAAEDLGESLKLLEAQYQLRALARDLPRKFATAFEAAYLRRTEAQQDATATHTGEECLLPAFNLFATHEVEISDEVRAFCAPAEAGASAELAAWRPRLALLLGREQVDAAADPFGPAAVCEAVLASCADLAATLAHREEIVAALINSALGELPELLRNATALLASHGVATPTTALQGSAGRGDSIVVTDEGAGGAAALPAAHSSATLGAALAELQRGAPALRLGPRSFALVGVAGDPPNVLRHLLANGLGEVLEHADRIVVDVVAALFEHLFNSASIPAAMKNLIAELQLPVLRVALADHSFFADRSHPARRLLNLLSLAAATWDGEFGPDSALYRKAVELIDAIRRNPDQDREHFEAGRAALEIWLNEQERHADARAAALTERLEARERQHLARQEARAAVAATLADESLPASLREFVGETWVKVLAAAQLDGGSSGLRWRMAMATLEDLCWSVRPKHGSEERERLARLLSTLLGSLREGMDAVGSPAPLRDAFQAELVRLHAAAVKAGMNQPSPPPPAAEARQPAYRGDAEPEPDRSGEFEVDLLSRGEWVELREPAGSVRRVRLTWVSPARTLYLFANRQGQRAVALTREELIRRYASGEAVTAGEDDLLDHIVDQALDSHENKA